MRHRRLFAAVAAAGLAVGTPVAAGAVTASTATAAAAAAQAPAAKFPVTAFAIDSRQIKVRSSKHKKLSFFLFLDRRTNSGPPDSVSVVNNLTVALSPQRGRGVVLASRPGQSVEPSSSASTPIQESHEWTFAVKKSSLHINTKKGTGTVKSKKLLKGFGRFTLKVSPDGKAHKSCPGSTGYTSSRTVTLVGSARFNTRSGKHGWGVVGAHRMTLKATLSVDHGTPDFDCGRTPQEQCPSVGIFVDSFLSNGDISASNTPGEPARLTAFRVVDLASPKGADRADFLGGEAKTLKLKHDPDGDVSFLISARSSNASGSATVSATPPPSTSTCKHRSSDDYFPATWTNGAHRLALRGQIEKPMTVKNNDGASAQVVTKTQ